MHRPTTKEDFEKFLHLVSRHKDDLDFATFNPVEHRNEYGELVAITHETVFQFK